MKAHTLIYFQSSFGITNKSLKILRNAIIDNIKDKILVVEVPTNDICCSFLILNLDKKTATWSGDGFRFDRGGEGGRGYLTALKLFSIFGINCMSTSSTEGVTMAQDAINVTVSDAWQSTGLLKACNKIAEEFGDEDYKNVYDSMPCY